MRLIYFTKKHQQMRNLIVKNRRRAQQNFLFIARFYLMQNVCLRSGTFFFSLSRASPSPTLKFISHSVCLSVDLITIFSCFAVLSALHTWGRWVDAERKKLEQGMFPMKSSCKVHLFYIKDQLLRLQILVENARRGISLTDWMRSIEDIPKESAN